MGALEPAESLRRPSSELFLAPPSLPITAATKTETFRVQRIPLDYTYEHVKGLFRPHDRQSIQIKSLARNLQAVLNPNHGWQTATFTYTCPDGAPQLPELVEEEDLDISIDRDFSGLTPLNAPSEPATAHVVAITGLTGNAFDTFSSSATRNWLRDCLPKDYPGAQVWLYGYEAEIDPSRGDSLSDKVDDLKGKLRQLFSSRHSWPRRIILVAHSLGCLITQKALVELSHSHPHIHAVISAVFFGAPNNGLDDNAFATLVAPHEPFLLENGLRPDSELIRSLQREFSVLASKMSILAFYETKDSPCVVRDSDGTWKLNVPHRIVKHKDASIHSHIPTPCRSSDHFTMPKLKPTEDAYGTVISFIQSSIQEGFDQKEDFDWLALDKRVSTASTHSASGSVNGWSQGNSTALTTPQSPDMRRDLTTFQKSKFTIFPTSYVPYDGSPRPTTASAQSSAQSPRPHTSPRPDASPVILPSPAIPSLPQFQVPELVELDTEHPRRESSLQPGPPVDLVELDSERPREDSVLPAVLPNLPELGIDKLPAELPASPVNGQDERFELPARTLSSRTPSMISDTGHRKLSFGRLRMSRTKSSPRSPEAVDRAAIAWFAALHESKLAEVKRLLGETKELLNAQDEDRHARTALHYAIENRSTSVFEFLMRRDSKPKLNINLVTTEGDTPLHYAARSSNHHYVQSLILKGAKWDAKNIAGDTPLHLAAQGGYPNVVGAFIELGAFTNIRDGMGRTPADVAVLMDHKEVVKRLQAGNIKAVVSYPGLF